MPEGHFDRAERLEAESYESVYGEMARAREQASIRANGDRAQRLNARLGLAVPDPMRPYALFSDETMRAMFNEAQRHYQSRRLSPDQMQLAREVMQACLDERNCRQDASA